MIPIHSYILILIIQIQGVQSVLRLRGGSSTTCKNCHIEFTDCFDMINHLEAGNCLDAYGNRFPVLLALTDFPCLACNGLHVGQRLIPHLKKPEQQNCRSMILNSFGIEECGTALVALTKEITKAKRKLQPSRLPVARQIENQRAARARKGPVSFIKATAIGPFRNCNSCGKIQSSVTCFGCKSPSREAPSTTLFDPEISAVDDLGMIAPFKNNSMATSSAFTMSLLPSSYFPLNFVTFKRAPSKKSPLNLDWPLDCNHRF